jgi:BirA family biotin operon repressor/biotin-[acetyl-CoA-carboxylase] ligase
MTPSSPLSIDAVQRQLRTRAFGKRILLFQEIDSTNSELLRQAEAGFPEGGVVLAEAQSRGKGRLGRKWISPSGTNLYLSLLLRPSDPYLSPFLSLLSAVAAAEAIEATTGISPLIKWPNDLLIPTPAGERKLGGILLELSSPATDPSLHLLIVGIGINVNLPQKEFPPEIASEAVSLCELVRQPVDRNRLAAELLNRMEAWYTRLRSGGPKEREEIRLAWIKRSGTLGRRVRIVRPQQTLIGTAEGITPEGALILRLESGETETFAAADVVHLRPTE